jgi:hypothetical protein
MQWRRGALLGIAQRRIRVKFSHKLRRCQRSKPLTESIRTIGGWIQVKRQEKNLTPGHLTGMLLPNRARGQFSGLRARS